MRKSRKQFKKIQNTHTSQPIQSVLTDGTGKLAQCLDEKLPISWDQSRQSCDSELVTTTRKSLLRLSAGNNNNMNNYKIQVNLELNKSGRSKRQNAGIRKRLSFNNKPAVAYKSPYSLNQY